METYLDTLDISFPISLEFPSAVKADAQPGKMREAEGP
jgi:hypothetical protein